MDEKSQPVCSLQSIYATSAPIFANGTMHMFGLIQCISGKSMMLVTPVDVDEIKCPICGQIHAIRNSFIPMSVDEFVVQLQQGIS